MVNVANSDRYLSDPEISQALTELDGVVDAYRVARANGEYAAICFYLGQMMGASMRIHARNPMVDGG